MITSSEITFLEDSEKVSGKKPVKSLLSLLFYISSWYACKGKHHLSVKSDGPKFILKTWLLHCSCS